jgi:hypothetical protein
VCHEVVAAGGDYLLFVKQNQPTLYQDLSLFFREPPLDCLDWRTASTTNKGHGRLENRFLWASTELNDFLARDWYGVEQVFCLRRRVEHALKCTQQIVYGITSLAPQKADPSRLLELSRNQWSIENHLHYRRDVTDGVKMLAKFAKALLLILWLCSILLCLLSSIFARFPTLSSMCDASMLSPCKPFVSYSSLSRKIK